MPFDLNTAQPVNNARGGFDLSQAKRVESPAARKARGTAAAKQAVEASRASPEQVEARRRDAMHPARRYLTELGSGGYEGPGIASAYEDIFDDGLPNPLGVLEAGATLATGAVSPILGGLDFAATNILDIDDPRNPERTPSGSMQKFIYEPRTETGKEVLGLAGAALKPVADLYESTVEGVARGGEALGLEPESAEAVGELVPALGLSIPPGVGGARAARSATAPRPPPTRAPVTPGPTADPVARARDAGYKLPASARTSEGKKAAGVVGRTGEMVSGRTQMQHILDRKNDQRVLEGIRKDLGLPEKAAVTRPAIDAILKETGLAYDAVREALPVLPRSPKLTQAIEQVGAARRNNPLLRETPSVGRLREQVLGTGDVDTGNVLKAIQEFRDDARLLSRNAEKPEQLQRAQASREMADALEAGLDEALTAGKRPDLIPALKNARTKRAKAHQAWDAVSGTDRPGLALMKMKQGGEFLSGEMDLAADVMRDMLPAGTLSVDVVAPQVGANTGFGMIERALQATARAPIAPFLTSELGQRAMFGPRVPESLSPYAPRQFDVPELPAPIAGGLDFEPTGGLPPGAAFRNPARPGDLELVPEPVPGATELPPAANRPGDLTASEPPAPGGLPFAAAPRGIASQIELAPESDYFPGARVPEEAALQEFLTDQPIGDRLARDVLDQPGQRAGAYADLDDFLNRMRREDEMPANLTDTELLELQLAPEIARRDVAGDLAASPEGINRVALEKELGQPRYLIDRDESTIPLVGVDAVDAVAQPGQVIVQQGIGADEFTILDRGGLSQRAAQSLLARAKAKLKPSEE